MGFETAALIALGAGAITSAYGSYRQGQAAEEAGRFNAEVSEANAQAARDKAAYEEQLYDRKARQLMGRQRVLYAKAGVDITEGSPLLVMATQAADVERDKWAIRYGGDVSATQELNKARIYRYQGKQGSMAGKIGAIGNIFSGVGTLGLSKLKWPTKSLGSEQMLVG